MSKNDDESIQFSYDKISEYLNVNKKKLVEMNLNLDTHQISVELTNSLNRCLLGNKAFLSDVYYDMVKDFDTEGNNVKIIQNQINIFNSDKENKFKYFVDPEEILYIVFYKQILYIDNLIHNVNSYIKSGINLVFIYAYLISKLYDEPNNVTSNYVFILGEKFKKNSENKTNINEKDNEDKKLEDFFSPVVIDKVYSIIKIIYSSDPTFEKLISNIHRMKIEEYKKNNTIDISESIKEIELRGKNIHIFDIDSKVKKYKDKITDVSKTINRDKIINDENNMLGGNPDNNDILKLSNQDEDNKLGGKLNNKDNVNENIVVDVNKDNKNNVIENVDENSDVNIINIENNFRKIKELILIQQREINIGNLYSDENIEIIFKDSISIEVWFGYNLFVHKRFIYNFADYSKIINEYISKNKIPEIYKLSSDKLDDINIPYVNNNYVDINHIEINQNLLGGTDGNYYKIKYLKYKSKYHYLKNTLKHNLL